MTSKNIILSIPDKKMDVGFTIASISPILSLRLYSYWHEFVFCCFLTLNYLDGFVLKKSKNHKNIFSQLQKVSKIFFSWNITFSPQLCQFRRIVLLNFRKRWTTLKKGRHSLATKTKKNSIFFEHHIFFTIFCLLSDCITKHCFLLLFDTKLP